MVDSAAVEVPGMMSRNPLLGPCQAGDSTDSNRVECLKGGVPSLLPPTGTSSTMSQMA